MLITNKTGPSGPVLFLGIAGFNRAERISVSRHGGSRLGQDLIDRDSQVQINPETNLS